MIHSSWKIKDVDNENIEIMLSYPIDYYKNRLKKMEFSGKDKILLDAGCGAGHWLMAASTLNKQVYGIDLTKKYLSYAQELKKVHRRNNIDLRLGKVEKLPYKKDFFDFIICYSVFMFTNKEKSLKEFFRVLKPGGKIYLGSITGYAWYPSLAWRGIKNGNPGLIMSSLKASFSKIPISQKKMEKMLQNIGFKIKAFDSDGQIGDKKFKIQPIYHGKRMGIWEVYEILALKPE